MEKEVTTSKVGVKYGILLAVVFILYGVILQFSDLATNRLAGLINYVFLIGFFILAHKEFKERNDGYMTYGEGLGIASIITALGAILSGVFTYVYIKFIDNSMIEKIREAQLEAMEERGMSDAEIEQALEMTSFMNSPGMLGLIGAVSLFIVGFILALIVTAITKKTNPEGQFIDNVR